LLYWPQYLLYGLKNRLQLDLIELGVTNRIGIIALSKVIQQKGFAYSELKTLKNYVKENCEKILEEIKNKIPQVSYEKLKENIDYMTQKNIY
jgi:hypothetical protein